MVTSSTTTRLWCSVCVGHVGEERPQGCSDSHSFFFFYRCEESVKLYRDGATVICRLPGGETAAGESAVRDSQDATEAGRAVCPARGAREGGGAGGGGGPGVNLG